MSKKASLLICSLLAVLGGCTASGQFDTMKAVEIGAGALQASMLDEESVKQAAALSAKELDGKSQMAPAGSPYVTRLAKITANMQNFDGLNLNFKVYVNKDLNAFAMADGTVRVHTGLLDAMPDDQVLAVIGHEIGHVKLKHSYQQTKEILLTNVAFQTVGAVGGTLGALTSSQLGTLAQEVINARFSQADELESDAYAVRTMRRLGQDPAAMKRSIENIEKHTGPGGGFLSTHPSNKQRIDGIQAEINRL
jgi:putative metalloprotease